MGGHKITDFDEDTGPFAATDWLYVLRSGLSSDRDAKVKATFFQPMHVKLAALSGGLLDGVVIGSVTPAPATVTVLTATAGIAAGGGFTAPVVFHTGGTSPATATTGTDTTPVVTETYIAEVFIPCNTTITGLALLNGSAVAGNIKLALASSAGAILAQTASTAASGTAGYQSVPLTATYAIKGPAKYFVLLQCNNTSMRFRSHAVGVFGAGKKTGETYGTFTAITPPAGFTANLGPIVSTY